jgi:hypothetical protein
MVPKQHRKMVETPESPTIIGFYSQVAEMQGDANHCEHVQGNQEFPGIVWNFPKNPNGGLACCQPTNGSMRAALV